MSPRWSGGVAPGWYLAAPLGRNANSTTSNTGASGRCEERTALALRVGAERGPRWRFGLVRSGDVAGASGRCREGTSLALRVGAERGRRWRFESVRRGDVAGASGRCGEGTSLALRVGAERGPRWRFGLVRSGDVAGASGRCGEGTSLALRGGAERGPRWRCGAGRRGDLAGAAGRGGEGTSLALRERQGQWRGAACRSVAAFLRWSVRRVRGRKFSILRCARSHCERHDSSVLDSLSAHCRRSRDDRRAGRNLVEVHSGLVILYKTLVRWSGPSEEVIGWVSLGMPR
jgi:hypothetical protein